MVVWKFFYNLPIFVEPVEVSSQENHENPVENIIEDLSENRVKTSSDQEPVLTCSVCKPQCCSIYVRLQSKCP